MHQCAGPRFPAQPPRGFSVESPADALRLFTQKWQNITREPGWVRCKLSWLLHYKQPIRCRTWSKNDRHMHAGIIYLLWASGLLNFKKNNYSDLAHLHGCLCKKDRFMAHTRMNRLRMDTWDAITMLAQSFYACLQAGSRDIQDVFFFLRARAATYFLLLLDQRVCSCTPARSTSRVEIWLREPFGGHVIWATPWSHKSIHDFRQSFGESDLAIWSQAKIRRLTVSALG